MIQCSVNLFGKHISNSTKVHFTCFNYSYLQTLTPPILVAQIGKPPHIAQSDHSSGHREDKLGLARPLASLFCGQLLAEVICHDTDFCSVPRCPVGIDAPEIPETKCKEGPADVHFYKRAYKLVRRGVLSTRGTSGKGRRVMVPHEQ